MAQFDPTLTPPKSGTGTELWYSQDKTGAGLKQIFLVQQIPTIQSAPDAQTYSCLENPNEGISKGTSKAQKLTIPILFSAEQHTTLKAFADNNTELYFWVKLPNTTVSDDKPICYAFSGTIFVSNDNITSANLQENLDIYRDPDVTEVKGLPVAG